LLGDAHGVLRNSMLTIKPVYIIMSRSQDLRKKARGFFSRIKDYGMTPLAPPNLRADPDAAMTTPGDTTTASLAEVEKVMKGAGARVDR
jgi:2-dehydro-3-deoxygluconokinase